MPTFADAYISSLGYLRPYVLFENNGELARKASARERARRAKKKIPHPYIVILPLFASMRFQASTFCARELISFVSFESKLPKT